MNDVINLPPEKPAKKDNSQELYFYGRETDPPTLETAEHFGSTIEPVLIEGGQKTTYRSGDVILKPSEEVESSNRIAEMFDNLPVSPLVRFAKPVRSRNKNWIEDGYVAWSFLEGKHVKGQYDQKLAASLEFHKLLTGIPKPDFLGTARSSWSTADLVAWQKLEFQYEKGFMDLYKQIEPNIKPMNLPSQLIHGDLSGNFLFDDDLPPAIIDFSPAWAPKGFAEGIMFADAITWENADPKKLENFRSIPDFDQFAWRGVLRRIAEQAEHIKWFDKSKKQALEEAIVFQKVIDYLRKEF